MIKELTSIRVILMLGVFLFHRGITSAAGIVAVACFFILGGFCSAIAYADKFAKPDFIYGKYVVNRLIKYYPIHWLFLLVSLICADFEIIRFFLNASLLQSWILLLISFLVLLLHYLHWN